MRFGRDARDVYADAFAIDQTEVTVGAIAGAWRTGECTGAGARVGSLQLGQRGPGRPSR